ncbi:MAG TPA: TetR/AcrR family transcriptional regulator [Vicinamibacterales bacterium]
MARQTPAKPARKRADQYHHGDLRRALLQAAVRTIHSRGIDGLTLRGVGSTLGVSRTALYRHFTDKSALLAAVAAEGFRVLREETALAWEDGGRGFRAFEAMGSAYVRFATTHPSHYRVMFGAASTRDMSNTRDTELDKEGAGAFQVLVDALADLQQRHQARRDDTQQMARFVWSAVHGVAMLAIDGRLGREPAAVDALTKYTTSRIVAAIRA